jgi:hypothetical protein
LYRVDRVDILALNGLEAEPNILISKEKPEEKLKKKVVIGLSLS